MKINSITIQNRGYVYCKSAFYAAQDVLSHDIKYTFLPGVNKLIGEIDSGIWAISYLLSMYQCQPKDFVLFDQAKVYVNDQGLSLCKLSDFSCYMDSFFPLFSGRTSVKKLVIRGLKNSRINYSCEDIRDLFHIDSERFEKTLKGSGNEVYKAMAAIGFSYGKEIYCFPWFSDMRFESYHLNLSGLLEMLGELEKIVIIPVGPKCLKDNLNDCFSQLNQSGDDSKPLKKYPFQT